MGDQPSRDLEKGRIAGALSHIIDRIGESLEGGRTDQRYSNIAFQLRDLSKVVDPLGPRVYDDAVAKLSGLITVHAGDVNRDEFGALLGGLRTVASDKAFEDIVVKLGRLPEVQKDPDKVAILRGSVVGG